VFLSATPAAPRPIARHLIRREPLIFAAKEGRADGPQDHLLPLARYLAGKACNPGHGAKGAGVHPDAVGTAGYCSSGSPRLYR
jgi:hypothetical protein